MNKTLAADPFGTIKPPPGSGFVGNNPAAALGRLISNGIILVLSAAAILFLVYLLWGGLDWITSGGDKEKVAKARQKLTNAVIGILVVVIALTIFGVVTGNVLGIMKVTPNGWEFQLPSFK